MNTKLLNVLVYITDVQDLSHIDQLSLTFISLFFSLFLSLSFFLSLSSIRALEHSLVLEQIFKHQSIRVLKH